MIRRTPPPQAQDWRATGHYVTVRPVFSFVDTRTRAVRPFVGLLERHLSTTRSAPQRTLRQPSRLFDQQSVEETESRTAKTTVNPRAESVRCQFWRQHCLCLVRKAGVRLGDFCASQDSSSSVRPVGGNLCGEPNTRLCPCQPIAVCTTGTMIRTH